MNTDKTILEILCEAAELQWGRCPPRNAHHFPITLWRFDVEKATKAQIERVMNTLREVLASPNLEIKWNLRHNGKNWVLEPAKADDMRRLSTPDWEEIVEREDPGFCLRANQDLVRITDEIAKQLGISTTE